MIQSLQELHNRELRKRRQDLTDSLVNNDMQSLEDYRYVTGEIQGLIIAEVLFNDAIAKMRNDEEDKRE